MKRSAQVTVAAMIAALGGGLAVLIGVFALAGTVMSSGPTPAPRDVLVASALFMLAAGIWSLTTSVGLLQLKPSARTSVLIFAGLLAFLGVMGTLFLLTSPLPMPPTLTPREFAVIRVLVAMIYLAFLGIGGWWLLLFNSKNIKAIFRGGTHSETQPKTQPEMWQGTQPAAEQEAPQGSAPSEAPANPWVRSQGARPQRLQKRPRPRIVTILGLYLLAGTLSAAVMILLSVPTWFMGMQLTGLAASVVYLGMFAAQGYIGIGILQLKPLSRVLAVYFFLFEFANSLSFLFLPGREARTQSMIQAMPAGIQSSGGVASTPASWAFPLIFSAITTLGPVWLLIMSKPVFLPPQHE